jgi:hypothetical protein
VAHGRVETESVRETAFAMLLYSMALGVDEISEFVLATGD